MALLPVTLLVVFVLSAEKMPELAVTSEIYEEYDYKTNATPVIEGNVISEFPFLFPKALCKETYDEDNDLDVVRPSRHVIKIEHRPNTNIALVGLQVWRGAFVLADLMIHLGLRGNLNDKVVLELGAGTGITSFIAAAYARKVICTDLDVGGILSLIKLNSEYNREIMKSEFKVLPLDFTETLWSTDLRHEIEESDILLAADVIYDDDVTAAFVTTLQKILNTKRPKTLYLALEKRYVFTTEHLESVAPCYETFLSLLDKIKDTNNWKIQQLTLDFTKYFQYDRVNQLVLWKITTGNEI